jgi:hypothetical protein
MHNAANLTTPHPSRRMKTIYKYPLPNKGAQKLEMPQGAIVRFFSVQYPGVADKIMLWAEVDPTAPKVVRHFYVAGTGWDVHDSFVYIATCLDGEFVWHLFEWSGPTA